VDRARGRTRRPRIIDNQIGDRLRAAHVHVALGHMGNELIEAHRPALLGQPGRLVGVVVSWPDKGHQSRTLGAAQGVDLVDEVQLLGRVGPQDHGCHARDDGRRLEQRPDRRDADPDADERQAELGT